MKTILRSLAMTALAFTLAALISACGGSGSTTPGSTPSGAVSLDVTDAPSLDYSHVYITVTKVGFHTDANAGSDDPAWQTVTLAAPVTVDLAQLANGTMYAGTNGGAALFSNFTLPVGTYRQIRIYLVSTEDALAASASALGLTYNNEVQQNGDSGHYALRIPTPDDGIRLVPESPVVVTAGGSVKLALDFNLNNDVVEVAPNGTTEFILKPRLGYFDMNTVGAVQGTVSFGNLSTSRIVVKAEQLKDPSDPGNASGKNYRIVRRWTGVDKSTGAFTLYPLPVFGNATTATYDILVRGLGAQTAIVKGVTVHKGTTPATGGVNLGSITLNAGQQYTAQLTTAMHPSGAWMNFYQTVNGDAVPFEVRYRHLNPYTGLLWKSIELSTGPIQVYSYNAAAGSIGAPTASPANGNFTVVADAVDFYGRGASMALAGTAGQAVLMANAVANAPAVAAPATANSITTVFDMTRMGQGLGFGMGKGMPGILKPTKGQLFVTHGGMIIDSLGTLTIPADTSVGNAMNAGGGAGHPVVMMNLPGGSAGQALPGAFYGVYGLGWGGGVIVAGSTHGIDLRSGNATATVMMR